MAAGLEVYNASGVLRLSLTDRITRYIGTQYTGTADGAISDPALALGEPWFLVTPNGDGANVAKAEPSVSISGTTLSWSFGGLAPISRLPIFIAYGVF
jgi:hypothetical protein